MPFTQKYDERTERMSLRIPVDLKNHIWSQAEREQLNATDVIVNILRKAYAKLPPAPQWQAGRLAQLARERMAKPKRRKRRKKTPAWAGNATTGVFE